MTSTIIGTGSFVPEIVVTNHDLEKVTATDAAWVESHLGIKERRVLETFLATSDMAVSAARNALKDAGLDPLNIDLIIVATATPDRMAPSTATIVQHKLGAKNAAAFDMNAVCTGFLYALHVANQFVTLGTYKNVLVIGADTFSRITDWTDRKCVFFGDGAGAVVVARGNRGFIGTHLYANGEGRDGFTVKAGGAEMPSTHETIDARLDKFQMDGRAVYDTATTVLPNAVNRLLKEYDYTKDDIHWVIPHQPSIKILHTIAESLDIPFHKVCTNMHKYANTSAATIPILLDEEVRSGLVRKYDLLLFMAVGSGWTWGVSLMRWSK